jgi:nucleoside-diphosphate-sugar epimerase|tara:strand:- start:715 stop:849 length:135 start_codon:yes stop_codon:yes gene_type:complete
MNILVTGAVGFIEFSLCEFLIKKKHKVFDTYYSIEIKKKTKNIK